MIQRVYTDDDRAPLVARVIAGESIHGVSQDAGVPYATLNLWVSAARDGALEASGADHVTPKQPIDHLSLWSNAAALAAQRIASNVTALPEEGLSPRDIQSLAIVGGISADKFLDLRDGRKGTQINIDQRSVHVLSADQARALLEDAQRLALPPPPAPDSPPAQ